MVSNARLDLPEPDKPVITMSLSRGRSISTPLRLCSRAPRTLMWVRDIDYAVPDLFQKRKAAIWLLKLWGYSAVISSIVKDVLAYWRIDGTNVVPVALKPTDTIYRNCRIIDI